MPKKRVVRRKPLRPSRPAKTSRASRLSSSHKSMSKSVPFPVKVVSVLLFIDAIACFLTGLAAAIAYFSSFQIISYFKLQGIMDALSTPLGITSYLSLAILFFVFTFIDLILSRGLWLGKNWARWIVIALMALVLVGGAINLDFISAIIGLAVGAYFLLSKRIQASFK